MQGISSECITLFNCQFATYSTTKYQFLHKKTMICFLSLQFMSHLCRLVDKTCLKGFLHKIRPSTSEHDYTAEICNLTSISNQQILDKDEHFIYILRISPLPSALTNISPTQILYLTVFTLSWLHSLNQTLLTSNPSPWLHF